MPGTGMLRCMRWRMFLMRVRNITLFLFMLCLIVLFRVEFRGRLVLLYLSAGRKML